MRVMYLITLLGVAACRAQSSDAHPARASDSTIVSVANEAPAVDTTPPAQTPASGMDFFSATDLAGAASAISHGTSTARILLRHPDRYYVEARRVANGVPEVHDDWIDVTTVQAGRATLLTGSTVRGSHVETPGEHRGGTIDGGARRTIATGDFFVIPSGMAHQYQVARGDSLRYLTVKVRRTR